MTILYVSASTAALLHILEFSSNCLLIWTIKT